MQIDHHAENRGGRQQQRIAHRFARKRGDGDAAQQAARFIDPITGLFAERSKRERRRDQEVVVRLFEEQRRQHDRQHAPGRRAVVAAAGRDVGPHRERRQSGAEAFQHHVGAEPAEGRACQREGDRNAAREYPEQTIAKRLPRDQPAAHDHGRPTDQARHDAEPVVDAADQQDRRQHETVHRRPHLGFFQVIEEGDRIEIAQRQRKVEAETKVAVAVVVKFAPERIGICVVVGEHDAGKAWRRPAQPAQRAGCRSGPRWLRPHRPLPAAMPGSLRPSRPEFTRAPVFEQRRLSMRLPSRATAAVATFNASG